MILNKICIYNHKIFLALDTYLIAYSYKTHSDKSQNKNFHECLKIKIPVKCLDIKEIKLGVIDNYITGLKSLLIVTFDSEGLNSAFIFCNAFRKSIYQIILPGAMKGCSFNMFISDGPSFLVHSINYAFHFHSLSCGITDSFDYKHLCFDIKEHKILQFQCFGRFHKDTSEGLFSLLVMSFNYSSQHYLKFIGIISEKNNSVIRCGQLQHHLFFPQHYESVLKAVQVIKVVPHFKAKSLCIENIQWVESMTVICTSDDCLVFLNAVLTYCFKLTLPLLDVMCMKAEFSSYFSDNKNLVLVFENMTVFFITMTKSNCEVVKHWTDIEIALTGDVLQRGLKEVLLIKECNTDSWENSCILYDISSFVPIDLLCHNVMPDKCLKATITGLERKVLVGLTAIKETEHQISQKSAATIDALIKLSEFRLNADHLHYFHNFQESLVDLILSKDENKIEYMPLECEPYIKLLNEEQRCVDKQWIIRLSFINDGERNICNPSIKVLMKNNEIVCIQKLFIYSSDTSFLSCEHSRQINPKMKFDIVMCFNFSNVHGDEEIVMILTWYNGSEDEFDNEIFITKGRKVLLQDQACFRSKIPLVDALNYKIKRDISSYGDILFLKALQQGINLSILSLHSNISRLEDMFMKNNFDSVDLHLFESSSMKCIVFKNEKSVLFGTHLVFKNSRHNVVEIEAFTRNEKEICLLIHYLYQHLPEDVVVFACLKFNNEFPQLKRNVVNSMKNEIDLLISSFNIHNVSEELRKNYSKLTALQTAGTISIPKVTYQRIRTALIKKECITDTILKCIS